MEIGAIHRFGVFPFAPASRCAPVCALAFPGCSTRRESLGESGVHHHGHVHQGSRPSLMLSIGCLSVECRPISSRGLTIPAWLNSRCGSDGRYKNCGRPRGTPESPSRTQSAFIGPTWAPSSEGRRTSAFGTLRGSPRLWVFDRASLFVGPRLTSVRPETLTDFHGMKE